MKKTLLIVAIAGLAFASCKKERDCECTTTNTSSSGTVTTSPAQTTTIKDIKGGEAKSWCQKSTWSSTDAAGKTTTTVNDCKLK